MYHSFEDFTGTRCLRDRAAFAFNAAKDAEHGDTLGHAVEFVKDQYRHCKAILANGHGRVVLEKAMIPLDQEDAALFLVDGGDPEAGVEDLIAAMSRHRNWGRAMDPPPV